MRILKDDSVTSENAQETLGLANFDGVIVRGADLLALNFDAIILSVPDRP
jgi:triosephosphate isomerase